MSIIKALIFDLDGVLADLCDLHRLTFIRSFNAAVGITLLDDDIHERHLEGLDTRSKLSVCKSLFPTYSFDSDAVFEEKQAKTADELALHYFQHVLLMLLLGPRKKDIY